MPEPILLVADKKKRIFDLPGFLACGQSGPCLSVLPVQDLVPLPAGSNLFFLPDRDPVGFNPLTGRFEQVEGCSPVAAFIPPGYTQLQGMAYRERAGAQILPLFAYTPVAFYKGSLHVPAIRIDRRKNHDMCSLDRPLLEKQIRVFKGTRNRLIRHLMDCALVNGCPNAINFFLEKYECPLPTSPSCNARCMGCISAQPEGSCPATQPRLTFVPTALEIAEVALRHIQAAADPVVSFGQGCEGEPLLSAQVIAEAIGIIRQKTPRGTIHMNTNGSLTGSVEALCRAGMDSFRVSINSAQADLYRKYYSPRGYDFKDVCASIRTAKRHKKFVALNYLVIPGLTDRKDEYAALIEFIHKMGVDMIQWRNLNYDPQLYFRKMRITDAAGLLGMRAVIDGVRQKFPSLKQGYFNIPKERQ